jgi:glucose dehydrogenase
VSILEFQDSLTLPPPCVMNIRFGIRRRMTMVRKALFLVALMAVAIATVALSQERRITPITTAMLQNPSPNDWLMFSRTYDAQRFSPLNQIKKSNVAQLKLAWSKDMATGTQESIPLVYDGMMVIMNPGAPGGPAGSVLWALDATNGNLIWEYRRPTGGASNTKTFAIYDDMVFYPRGDTITALDMKTGAVRWETKATSTSGVLTGGLVMAGDKIISGRTCGNPPQQGCYIAAHDAKTGKELWKFFTAAGEDDPIANASWGGAPVAGRSATTWGLTGSYDPVRNLVIWGVANPTPNTRRARHQGNSDAIGMSAPADLYSNSTVALDANTGKLVWYYQHLPGDDWDQDYTNERVLVRTAVNPDPKAVKWINPSITKNEQRDISLSVGEGGGLFALDRGSGQFLWAIPFPYDTPRFLISRIDPDGRTWINEDLIVDQPGERHVICAYNTKSYWPMAYHPGKNSLYIPYVDNCLDMQSANPAGGPIAPAPYTIEPVVCQGPPNPPPPAVTATPAVAPAGGGAGGAGRGGGGGAGGGRGGGGAQGAPGVPPVPGAAGAAAPGGAAAGAAPGGRGGGGGRGGAAAGNPERRVAIRREGSDPQKFAGIAKVNVATGELTRIFESCAPGNGATLATAGDLVFWGDLARRFRALDADNGKVLWETVLPGSITNSTITYSVNNKQYVAVLTGRGAVTAGVITQAGITPPPVNTNGVYVFALP